MSVQFLVIYPRVDLHNCQHNRDTGQPCHHKDPPPLPLYSQISQALITPHLQQPLPRPPLLCICWSFQEWHLYRVIWSLRRLAWFPHRDVSELPPSHHVYLQCVSYHCRTCPLQEILVMSRRQLSCRKLLHTTTGRFLCRHTFSFFWGRCTVAGMYNKCEFCFFKKLPSFVPERLHHFTAPQAMCEGWFLCILARIWYCHFVAF